MLESAANEIELLLLFQSTNTFAASEIEPLLPLNSTNTPIAAAEAEAGNSQPRPVIAHSQPDANEIKLLLLFQSTNTPAASEIEPLLPLNSTNTPIAAAEASNSQPRPVIAHSQPAANEIELLLPLKSTNTPPPQLATTQK